MTSKQSDAIFKAAHIRHLQRLCIAKQDEFEGTDFLHIFKAVEIWIKGTEFMVDPKYNEVSFYEVSQTGERAKQTDEFHLEISSAAVSWLLELKYSPRGAPTGGIVGVGLSNGRLVGG